MKSLKWLNLGDRHVQAVYKIFPAFIHYKDAPKDEDSGGKAKFMFIKIWKKYKYSYPLLVHELQHVKQFYRTLGLHIILSTLGQKTGIGIFKRYKIRAEIDAFYHQMMAYPESDRKIKRETYINYLVTYYDLCDSLYEARVHWEQYELKKT